MAKFSVHVDTNDLKQTERYALLHALSEALGRYGDRIEWDIHDAVEKTADWSDYSDIKDEKTDVTNVFVNLLPKDAQKIARSVIDELRKAQQQGRLKF